MEAFTVTTLYRQITEAAETFTLTLKDPEGGAVLGSNSTCTVVIVANDYPLYFDSEW